MKTKKEAPEFISVEGEVYRLAEFSSPEEAYQPTVQCNNVWINGRKIDAVVSAHMIGYNDIVSLAGRGGDPTVVYYRGPKNKPSGTILPGDQVELVDGMVFNVHRTDNA